MTATVPRGAGLFCRILVELIQVRCLGMTRKREAPVNKVSQSKGWCFNHLEIVLMPWWGFFCCFYRRDSNLVKEEIKTFLNNRRISQAIVGQVTGTLLLCGVFTQFLQLLKQLQGHMSNISSRQWQIMLKRRQDHLWGSSDWFEFDVLYVNSG